MGALEAIRRIGVSVLLCMLAANSGAHELEANRLTLVLRDRNHLSLTFFIDYTEALHRALSPRRPFHEFVLVYSAMKPEDLRAELLRAQARFQADTRLTLAAGKPVAVTNWRWPDADRVQAMLRERAMQAVVAPGDHAHAAPVEIHAEVTSTDDIGSLAIRLPEELQRVLVVSYRPSQRWVEANKRSTEIGF
jgi:hypothetical protein